ncbi:mitosis inhibitor protein kinase [Podospora conica]|nr:mitosis inhibitor protein kinase [Schizothecium conicum]
MVYSNSGSTLTLPSPTHGRHVDVGSAVRRLRRTMSRSPSKFGLSSGAGSTPGPVVAASSATPMTAGHFGFGSFGSTTPPSPDRSAVAPGPVGSTTPTGSPSHNRSRANSNTHPHPFTHSPPQLSTTPSPTSHYPPSVKLSLRSARSKPSSTGIHSRIRASPRSPLKRVFGPSPDSGNSIAPPSTSASACDPDVRSQENPSFRDFALGMSPVTRRHLEKQTRHSMPDFDVSGSPRTGAPKFAPPTADSFATNPLSPLKRTDAMSVDQSSAGSPVAKRRSLHGGLNLGATFPTWDSQTPATPTPSSGSAFDIHEDTTTSEYQLFGSVASPFHDAIPSPAPMAAPSVPKRTASLRKSTLQQRHGEHRTSWGRRAGERSLAQMAAQMASEAATPAAPSHRTRLSGDHFLPPDERGAPLFPQMPSYNNPAVQPLARPANQRHPLSRTITQSSSSSSVQDESPTHVPVSFGGIRPRNTNFSKSLPPGSLRPVHDSNSVATPSYKHAKPFQAAFTSTGLVSKMNRNPEIPLRKTIPNMPDTPCKKPYQAITHPQAGSGGRRASRASPNISATPFGNSTASQNRGSIFGSRDKPSSFFLRLSGQTRLGRTPSFEGQPESVGSQDDFPSTPSRSLMRSVGSRAPPVQTASAANGFISPASASALDDGMPGSSPSSKSEPFSEPVANDRPAAVVGHSSSPATPGVFTRLPALPFSGRRLRPLRASPASNSESQLAYAHVKSLITSQTDASTPASPLPGMAGSTTPRTPRDAMAPLDASRLSISGPHDDKPEVSWTPATPTTQAGRMLTMRSGGSSATPQNGHGPREIEESLAARFDESEPISKGEFGTVYKVVKSSVPTSLMWAFTATPSRRSPTSSTTEVYAVKKQDFPIGRKAREAKLREVEVLKALSHSDKVIHFFDSWVQNNNLYIQTEFCSEGSLDRFLAVVGNAGKLDDFRIWKIFLESLEGLRAIHDAGFAHFDLKPANIFITHDGYLKIGDFGMATPLPASNDIDREGDRGYLAPEILRGQYDKPADIFALGLIILEAALNSTLPGSGDDWQLLRNGDISYLGVITGGEASAVARDADGIPIGHESSTSQLGEDALGLSLTGKPRSFSFGSMTHDPSNLFGVQKRRELRTPPEFMRSPEDPTSLDNLLQAMLRVDPAQRPNVHQLLEADSLTWVAARRTAGATVYEGNWGPEQPLIPQPSADTEMTDV